MSSTLQILAKFHLFLICPWLYYVYSNEKDSWEKVFPFLPAGMIFFNFSLSFLKLHLMERTGISEIKKASVGYGYLWFFGILLQVLMVNSKEYFLICVTLAILLPGFALEYLAEFSKNRNFKLTKSHALGFLLHSILGITVSYYAYQEKLDFWKLYVAFSVYSMIFQGWSAGQILEILMEVKKERIEENEKTGKIVEDKKDL